jgi:hypothetical protein
MNCKYSGEEFTPVRSDQKFASANNRIKFHNERYKKIRKAMSEVDGKLRKNYSILIKLMDGEKTKTFHKYFLLGKGYSFDVLTHYDDYEGKSTQALYEFLILVNKDTLTFIRREQ